MINTPNAVQSSPMLKSEEPLQVPEVRCSPRTAPGAARRRTTSSGDHELVAALEQVQERDRAVRSDDLDPPIELHHRQPAARRGESVALADLGLPTDQKLLTPGESSSWWWIV
jgi:hypothetical protein